ncbi:MAG: hypothetical protein HYV07_12290 [Deltaproteobacteria bacterium]|nr:hypothetical protein [Deltaproteobacteria bacterium]
MAPRWSSVVTVLVATGIGAAVVVSTMMAARPMDPPSGSPFVDLEAQVGRTVTVAAWLRGDARRFFGQSPPGKSAYWVRLSSGRRALVHSATPLDCEGAMSLTGTVVRVNAIAQGTSTTSLQLDVTAARCLEPGR